MKTKLIDELMWKLKIDNLTPMQEEVMTEYHKFNNIVLLSPTGSGKTLAYLFPLVHSLKEEKVVQTIILVPSRELALQIENVFKQMGTLYSVMSCYGGRPTMDEHRKMNNIKPQVIIGTPGRINDHLIKQNIDSSTITTLIIDEFDKCLEMGFQDEMSQIISKLQNLNKRFLLSATDKQEIPDFVSKDSFIKLNYLIDEEQIPDRISLFSLKSPEKDKLDTLRKFLCVQGSKSCLVFVNYRESVERVYKYLSNKGFECEMFHGGMEQRDRERSLYKFTNGSSNIFVSTDLASRGLDIPDISFVIHYHLPLNEDSYIHRNGRTARWNDSGNAIFILGPEERIPEYVRDDVNDYILPANIPQPSKSLWTTLYIGKGKKDKINKIDIVGFLAKVGGLDKDSIGRIDVMDHHAYVAVLRKNVKKTLIQLKGKKIKGIKTIIEESR